MELQPISSKQAYKKLDAREEIRVQHEGKELILIGYRTPPAKLVIYIALCVATVGLFYLFTTWILKLRMLVLHSKCSMGRAQYVLVEEVEDLVKTADFSDEVTLFLQPVAEESNVRFFVHKGLRYVWDPELGAFQCHEFPVARERFAAIHERARVERTEGQRAEAFIKYGPNRMEVPSPTVVQLLVDELLHPFYMFQIVSVTIWVLQFYLIYAGCIFGLATLALIFSVYQMRKNNQALADMARHVATVNLVRKGERVLVDAADVVPGDMVQLDQNSKDIVCDMVLMEGECVVNESSLTGESVPVIKTPLARDQSKNEPDFDFQVHSKNVLFCGTELRRVKGDAIAFVVRTGFQTAKGDLIRQILYPKASVFPFYRDALIFILGLLIITLGAFGWAIWKFVRAQATWWFTTLRVLDLITTVIPPALPIAMSAGASFAVMRLRKNNIYCVQPKLVNVAGRCNIFCFDKTGTLTKDHMDVHCVKPASHAAFLNEVSSMSGGAALPERLMWALAACHSVVRLSLHETIGDPLEVKMMEWSGWTPSSFDDSQMTMTSPDGAQKIVTLARNEFLSQLARMSVIVKGPDDQLWALAKGSPEGLRELCDPKSLPKDFDGALATFTAQGMRTIALGCKRITDTNLSRDDVERDLTFLGFLVLVNPLKPETPGMLNTLTQAKIRVVMITGDNALTAVNVARKSGLSERGHATMLLEFSVREGLRATIVHADRMSKAESIRWEDVMDDDSGFDLAMTGAAFTNLRNTQSVEFVRAVLAHASVFARTNPIQKTQIVMTLKCGTLHTVGMCGDGSNDCGALKAADCGLSISDGEAAIAAPFSAASITSVVDLLLEGRGALATSFALFKYMIMYSVIQTTQVMCCYLFLNLLADIQFLWNDLFLILPLSFSMGLTKPTLHLVASRPPATLFRMSVLLSVVGHMLFLIIFYATIVVWSQHQIFVTPENQPTTLVNGTTPYISVAGTVIWLVGNFLYVTYSLAFSISKPFRLPFYHNILLLLSLVTAFACNVCWMFVQTTIVISFWQLILIPVSFMGQLFGAVMGFTIFTYLYEFLIITFVQGREARLENESLDVSAPKR